MHIVTLASFAVAQPLFDLLGRNASFFVAHRADGAQILLLTAVVALVPATVLLATRAIVSAVSTRAGNVAHNITIGALGALALTTAVVRAARLGFVPALALAVVLGTAVAIAYARAAVVRRFLTVLSPVIVIFPALFLFVSPVRDLLFAPEINDVAPAAKGDAETSQIPVVFVLFDELSLSTLITPDGDINAKRYPGFARLAKTSTWYREATTVALRTDQAVPALLTGRRTARREVPSSHAYPNNVFRLVSGTHRLDVREFVTQLCAPELCEPPRGQTTQGLGPLFSDAAVVYLHIVTPADLARTALPPLGDRWAGFTRDPGDHARSEEGGSGDPVRDWLRSAIDDRETQDEGEIFDAFLDDLRPRETPIFSYMHVQVPHPPWRYLPTGQTYPTGDTTPGYRNFRWGADRYLATEVLQRSLLQTLFADDLAGRLLDRLEETDLMDDALVIVTSDHGATWSANGTRRELGPAHRGGMLGVPLFVKYPEQRTGRMQDGNAETIDIVPTIADVLGLEVPWDVDGSSLRGDPRDGKQVFDGNKIRAIDVSFDGVRRRAAEVEQLFGDGDDEDDFYAFGPYRKLVGRSVDDFEVDDEPASFSVDVGRLGAFDRIDIDQPVLPALLRGTIDGRPPDGTRYVVALNGVVAGAGQTYTEDGKRQIAVMLSHRRFRDGHNDVALYEFAGDDRLRPIRINR